jgi:hypothetical protein
LHRRHFALQQNESKILKAPHQKSELDREIRRLRRSQCVIDQRE